MKYKLIILILITLFSSCRKLVQDEFDEFEKKISVNSIIVANDTIKMYISNSDGLNEDSLTAGHDNAVIIMYNQDSVLLNFFYKGGGLYISDYVAHEDDSFNLKVSVPQFEMVSSSCHVPESQDAINVNFTQNYWVNSDGKLCPNVKFKLENEDVDRYYCASVRLYETSINDSEYHFGGEGIIDVFNDLYENGDYIERTVDFLIGMYGSDMEDWKYQLVIKSVDVNYYNFLKSYYMYTEGRSPDFSTTSIVPQNLFSNIENGYGIMCAYSFSLSDTL